MVVDKANIYLNGINFSDLAIFLAFAKVYTRKIACSVPLAKVYTREI